MHWKKPTLYIFSGLPGTGKTTLAKLMAEYLGITYLRIDTIEQGLRDICSINVEGEGYRLSYRIAKDNLLIGNSVIADSCNPWTLTRREWEQTALDARAKFVNIQILCSQEKEHQMRVANKISDIAGFQLPTWEEIKKRRYDKWKDSNFIVIDTASKTPMESFRELSKILELQKDNIKKAEG